ncbi:hypothetical protein L6164_014995 [Bauhinia variegata]|uniref:Uncharacterized protein n=1 Tax=Bauhinia variegata TaxID=167791 RepID=A0ACB9NJD1_BAUVA|nr:hypothetical protein L6164_014995 [Bauhinia variegata]
MKAKSHVHISHPDIRKQSSSRANLRLEKTPILNWSEQDKSSTYFIVCNDWYQAIDKISGSGVSRAIDNFATSLHQLYERQEQVEKLKMEYLLKDYDHRLRSFRKENGISWHKDSFHNWVDLISV